MKSEPNPQEQFPRPYFFNQMNLRTSLSPSVKQNCSTTWFSCCFRGSEVANEGTPAAASLLRSSSKWIHSKAGELPELTERCKGMLARMCKSSRRGYGEFRYDPLSYALNFDEGGEIDDAANAKEFMYRNFSSRLPATPPHAATGVAFS